MALLLLLLVLCVMDATPQSTPAEIAFSKAIALRDSGKKIEALREFRQAAKFNPALPFVYREIGLILLDQRDFKGAAAAFRSAVQRDPDDFDSRYNLALSQVNAGQKEEGLKELRYLSERRPDWALPLFGMGHTYAASGRTAEAEEALRRAVKLDPKLFRAQFELAKLLEERGDHKGAIAALTASVEAAPDSTAARFRLAKLLQQDGQTEEAAREFRVVRERRDARGRGEQAATAFRQGLNYLNAHETAAAIREFQRGLELRPDFPELRAALATAYEERGSGLERSGDLAGAIENYRLALQLEPSPVTENHVGVLLGKSGRMEEAIACFRRALALKPDYASARTNLEQAMRLKGEAR